MTLYVLVLLHTEGKDYLQSGCAVHTAFTCVCAFVYMYHMLCSCKAAIMQAASGSSTLYVNILV